MPSPQDTEPVPVQALLDGLPDPTVLIDAHGVVVWANRAAERSIGVSRSDWIGRSGLDLVHPSDLEKAIVSLSSVQKKQVGTPVELQIRAGSVWRLAEVVGAPVPGGDGHVVLTLRDITARRRWEVARDETAKLRALVHHAPTLFILLDAEGTMQATSGALTRELGHEQEALEGCSIVDLAAPSERGRLQGVIDRVLAGGGSQTSPARIDVQLRDQRRRRYVPYELSIVDLVDDPTVGGLVVTGHDIGERTATEEALRDTVSLLGATLDATADGILAVDRNGRITSYNARLLDMWKVPADMVRTGMNQAALRHVSEQLCDAEGFLTKVQELNAEPESDSFDILTFTDGRVFERYSRPQRVAGVVTGRVWGFHDITRQKQLERELEHQAFHDSLTGLANQSLFRDRVDHALARATRNDSALAVLYLDVDDFKRVNDSLGHRVGDQLLVAVTERLAGCVRHSDTTARLGGDEFAILVENLGSGDDPTEIADRIIEEFQRPVEIGSRRLVTSVSIGIAFSGPGVVTEQVLRNADLAMYAAKRRGKARYELYVSGMHAEAVARLEIEADLRVATERDELWVAYQPIVELGTARLAGMEALVRWQHPRWGVVGPDTFIAAAEEIGIIGEIGSFVLQEACVQAQRWTDGCRDRELSMPQLTMPPLSMPPLTMPPLTISVNVSSRQLTSGTVVDEVEAALEVSGLDPGRLVLELTETAMLEDTCTARRTLDELKRLGVRLALDDFGTGFSSLTHLQQFPIDIIKIDRSFMTTTGHDEALVRALIRMSQELGLVVIAEGIETAEQLTFLQDAGCELGQGHFFARPDRADVVQELVSVPAERPAVELP